MKRTLTGIAAVAVTLGAASPMAFAATGANGWQYKVAAPLPIVVNGSAMSAPYELTAQDSGNTTAYFPVYYFDQALSKIGYTATWDGVTHTWAITASGVDASKISIPGGVGTGNTTITVNGTVIKKINTGAAKDPAGGGMTTYFPAFYINEVFNSLGAKVSFSGQTGLSISGGQSTAVGSSLSNITVSGESSGNGSSASPAVSLTGKGITVSSTLTDANGNPVANTAVQFQVSEYGTKPSNMPLPTVTDANGTVISGTSNSDNEAYTAYTNSNGVASLTIAGPAGQTYAYEVVATAPYQSSGMAVMSKPAYTEFVANNEAAITPFAGQNTPFQATMGKGVPVTVALPPNSNGSARSNVLVTLKASNSGYFTNSAGADLGSTVQVATNSSGIAQAWLNDANSEEVTVSATLPAGIGLNDPSSTYINFAQGGIAARVNNYSISSNNLQAGQDVTVSGQLVDASGNAVANAQVLVVGNDVKNGTNGSDNNGSFGYVTTSNGTSTVTDFPDVGLVSNGAVPVAQGISASSTTGDVVTADSNGNFSFVVTDTNDDEAATFSIYAVNNGEVASNTPLKSDTIDFSQGTQLGYIALGANDSQAQGNSYTSLTGLSATNHTNGLFFVDPQNAAGNPLLGQSLNYNMSVTNGGTITGIATVNSNGSVGSVLPINSSNPGLSALTVQETANSDGTYTISVPGQSGSVTTVKGNADFAVYVQNGNTGDTKVSMSSGSVSSTADFNFTGGQPTYVQSFSPSLTTLASGQTQKFTFTVEDDQGNAVANAETTLKSLDTSDSLYVTAINGVALDQSENMGTSTSPSYSSEPTPIPLGTPSGLGYSTVNIPGVVSWSNTSASDIKVYSDASGNVSLTLQNGGASYYVAPGAGSGSLGSSNAAATNAAAENFYTWDSKGDSSGMGYSLAIGQGNNNATNLTQQLGTINFGSGSTTVAGNGTITVGALSPLSGNTTANAVYGAQATVSQSTSITGGTWSASIGGNTASNVTFNNNNGTETATFAADSKAGSYTFDYSLNGTTEATGSKTLPAGSAVGVDVSGVLGGASINSVSSPSGADTQTLSGVAASGNYTLQLQYVDAAGNVVTSNAAYTATVSNTHTGASVTTSGNLSNGVAVINYTAGSAASPTAADTITITVGSFTDTITTNAY